MTVSAMEVTSGRYISGPGVCEELGRELCLISAKKVYLMGGRRALEAVLPRLELTLTGAGMGYKIGIFEGFCTRESAQRHAQAMKASGCDAIVAVGGGRCIDTAKAAADLAGCQLGTIPTQAATCVSCTNMAILYEESGRYLGPMYPRRPIAFTLVDEEVLAKAPVRYLAAGIADALAKYPELRFSQRGGPDCSEVDDAALQAAHALSISTWDTLTVNGRGAWADNGAGRTSPRLSAVLNADLVLTGTISGLAKGSRQLAVAHAVYNYSTVLFPEVWRSFLHGEIVSVGILLQLYLNRSSETQTEGYVRLARDLGVPICLRDLGIQGTGDELDSLWRCLLEKFGPLPPDEAKRMREGLEWIVSR